MLKFLGLLLFVILMKATSEMVSNIKFIVLFLLVICFGSLAPAYATNVSGADIRLMNELSAFIDEEAPQGRSLRTCEEALKNNSAPVKGLAAIILYKHYGDRYKKPFEESFSLNHTKYGFEQGKKIMISINNVSRLLDPLDKPLQQFNDPRVRSLFLFYHFRHKNVIMLGNFKEELSLADFYRISIFNSFFPSQIDASQLAASIDK